MRTLTNQQSTSSNGRRWCSAGFEFQARRLPKGSQNGSVSPRCFRCAVGHANFVKSNDKPIASLNKCRLHLFPLCAQIVWRKNSHHGTLSSFTFEFRRTKIQFDGNSKCATIPTSYPQCSRLILVISSPLTL